MTTIDTKKRTRSGCFSCRSRKKKCDGLRPQCSSCRERGAACQYGVKASFHPSRHMQLSAEDRATLSELGGGRRGVSQCITRFVDDTGQIVRSYSTSRALDDADQGEMSASGSTALHDLLSTPAKQDTPTVVSTSSRASIAGSTSSTRVDFSRAPSLQEPAPAACDLRVPLERTNRTDHPPECSACLGDHHESYPAHIFPECYDASMPASMLEQIQLIQTYLIDTGTWLEATDDHRHFTVSYVHRLMTNKPFVAAAVALASRQLDIIHKTNQDRTLSLYQHAVQSLLRYEPSQCGEATLVCCILLSFYELITSDASEWRRHLKVCPIIHSYHLDVNGTRVVCSI